VAQSARCLQQLLIFEGCAVRQISGAPKMADQEAPIQPKRKPAGGNSFRRASMQMMNKFLGAGSSRFDTGGGRSKKKSLSVWKNFETVSFTTDAKMDWEEQVQDIATESAYSFTRIKVELPTWLIPALCGVATAVSGWLIEIMVDVLGDLRLGYCDVGIPGRFFKSSEMCEAAGKEWKLYTNLKGEENSTFGYGYFHYIWFSTLLATISAAMTAGFAPAARGSGIPEIKTILGGFVVPNVLETNTLFVKVFGLALSVAAGLSCGKEGPLVHIACCWSHLICKFDKRFARNEGKQRECLSCACAAGVAVAFGAPLGGVLFSLEEASTYFPTRTMIRAFFAGSVAALTLALLKHGQPTTMFEAAYSAGPHPAEFPIFILIGILGGCIGAFFVSINVQKGIFTAPTSWWRKRVPNVVEVCGIAFITALTSFHNKYTRVISNATIHALFQNCHTLKEAEMEKMYGLCVGTEEPYAPNLHMEVVTLILIAGTLRYFQMMFTFGCGAPSGLFIPSLYTGAALGRAIGVVVFLINVHVYPFTDTVYPGVYSMLGAAAVLGGVCRVTISLVVIMFELTGGLKLIVPFMLVCMFAKWTGDYFTPGIYDYCITIRKYPFLHEHDDSIYNHFAKDIMDTKLDLVHPEEQTLGSLKHFFGSVAKYTGYPITKSETDRTVMGYMLTKPIIRFLDDQVANSPMVINEKTKVGFYKLNGQSCPVGALDLSKFVDDGIMQVVPEQRAADIHRCFRLLGIKTILVTKYGQLEGMITKKVFVAFMEDHHHGSHDSGKQADDGQAAEAERGLPEAGGLDEKLLKGANDVSARVGQLGSDFASLNSRLEALELKDAKRRAK